MSEALDARALTLAQKLIEHRKDDTQGISVKVQSGDQAVELAITAKPSSGGGWRGGGGAAAQEAHSVEEVEAAMKAAGLKQADYKVWAEDGKVYAKWPYDRKDEPGLKALGMRWDPNQKASWSPLRGAAAPSP